MQLLEQQEQLERQRRFILVQVKTLLHSGKSIVPVTEISIQAVAITGYDQLLQEGCG